MIGVKMKYMCNKCRKLVDEEDVIISMLHAPLVGTSIFAHCPKCWESGVHSTLKGMDTPNTIPQLGI